MRSRSLGWRIGSAVLVTMLCAATGQARVVAVGDIHGELAGFSDLLQRAELVDEEGSWAGGDATLVQLGDYTDRGPDVRGVMDLLRRLQDEAKGAGGEAVVLIGNHEGMNLLGEMRDVSEAAVAKFADDDSETLRRRGLEAWENWLRQRASWRGDPAPRITDDEREAWLADHPPGWIEYLQALGPEGEYGKWIRTLPVAAVRADTLFMHAGLSPEWSSVPVEELNDRHREAFEGADRTRALLIEEGLAPFWADREAIYETLIDLRAALDRGEGEPPVSPQLFQKLAEGFDGARWTNEPASPLWFRGYAQWPDPTLALHVAEVLKHQGVERLVGGHSPSSSYQVVRRDQGRVYLIDTGMLASVYGGRASALVLGSEGVDVVYGPTGGVTAEAAGPRPDPNDGSEAESTEDSEGSRPPRHLRGRDGSPLPFDDDEEILDFLEHARIVESEPLNVGVTGAKRLVLERDGVRVRAVFHHVNRAEMGPTRFTTGKGTMHFVDSYRSQVAAYELARLLGRPTVPPTITRSVDRSAGSVQLWIEGATTWGSMQEKGTKSADPGFERRQLDDMWVFDNLVGNTDRNQGNILFDRDGHLWWIDHTRCFSPDRKLPSPERVLRVSRDLWNALKGLDEASVNAALSEHLSPFQIKALLARRDRLVELIEERIAKHGEPRVVFDLDAAPTPDVAVATSG